jgi:hypothetical protein
VTICPCCGSKSEFVLSATSEACASCGAQPVGEPLPRPDHELPSYGRSLALTITGALMVLALVTEIILALVAKLPTGDGFSAMLNAALDYRIWLAASETAAWRWKWVALPMTFAVLYAGRRIYRSIECEPSQFCGLKYARGGYAASAAIPFLILLLIGITVPERLQQRQDGIEAGNKALGYQTDRLLIQYQKQFGTFPSELKDLERLPDPDGSIASLLKTIESSSYKPTAEVAAVPTQKPRPLRGAVISKASLDSGEPLNESLSFSNYELRLPGYDKVFNTEDDVVLLDGVVQTKTTGGDRRGATDVTTRVP